MKKILFITWDGPETNYIKTLFVPIFLKLEEKFGYKFSILQYTWGGNDKVLDTMSFCEGLGISYTAVQVPRKIPAFGLLWAYFVQSSTIRKIVKKQHIDIVMPRATTSAALVQSVIKKLPVKFVFDADGFSQDERVEFSGWDPNGLKYKTYRKFERQAFRISDVILCRSSKAKEIIAERAGENFNSSKVHVITNGKDIATFKDSHIQNLNEEPLKLIYVGSLGPKYRLDSMLQVFEYCYKKDDKTSLTILTSHTEIAMEAIHKLVPSLKDAIEIKKVLPSEIPDYISRHHIGLGLIQPTFSVKGVAAIKVSEYLLCGTPVIINKGVGDSEAYVKDSEAAYVVNDLENMPVNEIVSWCFQVKANASIRKEARALGVKYFNVEDTVTLYHNALQKL